MIWRKKEKKKAQYQFNSERVFLVATQPAKTAYSYFQTSSVGLSEEEIGQRQSAMVKMKSHESKRRIHSYFSSVRSSIRLSVC